MSLVNTVRARRSYQSLSTNAAIVVLACTLIVGCSGVRDVTLWEPEETPLHVQIMTNEDPAVPNDSPKIRYYPHLMEVRVGDTVNFSGDRGYLLCVSKKEVFGGERFVIGKGETLKLLVRSEVASPQSTTADFGYMAVPYPDNIKCPPSGEEGKGKVGGGG